MSNTVVFISGTFIANNCWDEWKTYFKNHGYNCVAPAWPHKAASAEVLRNRHPDTAIASNTLTKLTNHFAGIIKALPEKPILIGHSIGGLIVQFLLYRGLCTAAVAIHSFPPAGIHSIRFSFQKIWWNVIGFFTSVQTSYMISFKQWKHIMANGMPCAEQKESFYKYAIPESKRVIRDAFKCRSSVNFKTDHPPLLFVSGGQDRIIPASLNYTNYKKYSSTNSITNYMDFKDSNHLVFNPPGLANEAEFVLSWLQKLK